MKRPFKYLWYILVGLPLICLLVQCGLKAITVTMPEFAKANERITFVLHSATEPQLLGGDTYTTQLRVGIMVPKSWNARQNAALRYTSNKGSGTLQMIPDSEIEPESGLNWPQAAKKMFGIGPNLVDDFEWIVYRSREIYTFVNDEKVDFDVQVDINAGAENMLVRLGFYLGAAFEPFKTTDNDMKKFIFSDVFEVMGGEGDLIDFVNPQLGTVQPVKSLDNDIITLTFNGGVTNTVLDNINDIYLHARAYNDADQLIGEISEVSEKTKLQSIGGKRFLIDIWPRGFFQVAKGVQIARLEYFFTDETGMKTVGYGNTDEPFKYTFRCE